ncbi:hypothetical protein KAT92_02395, partial [Candidatus Babeliales bacterium]|nr:hypothetical protein [Candidatus Babeliales bacterium]
IKHLNKYGIEGLLNPVSNGDGTELQRQLAPNHKNLFKFYNLYKPNLSIVRTPYPYEDINLECDGAYALYNWELFFHAPLLIATRLSQNQRFEEAQKWFHYIFDPTETDGNVPERFWKFKPFYEMGVKAQQDLEKLSDGDEELEKQIEQWQDNPFQPHLIARLRIVAYMKTVVMKYIDNLIAWGDHLFRRNTIESINEAARLYILAAQILGKRLVMIKGKELRPQTFNDLLQALTELGNALIDVESQLPVPLSYGRGGGENSEIDNLNTILYFCIPKNDKLLSYWDTVADRLFKIRHCMNIEGVVRQLPLFEPPIDPGLLVKAVAAGTDLSSALNDLYASLPHYRFQFMLQKTVELCNDVKSLGASLLSTLEKGDAEKLALLRAGHEVQLLKAVKDIKKQNIKEAEETLNSLNLTKEVTNIRLSNYRNRKYINPKERLNFRQLREAHDAQDDAATAEDFASIMHNIPDISTPMGPGIPSSTFGGSNFGAVANAVASFNRHDALGHTFRANRASTNASYERRQEDWDLQIEMATKELEQNDKQIAAAEIRKAVAEKDLENHEFQTGNAQEVEQHMKDKFTNQQLYNWMISQISSIYFQSYQMAYDLAKRAEKAFRHELAIEGTNFIQFGYWDSLKKGLLAGERLHRDLKRMEVAYLEQNKREYELTKHISLAMLNPEALLKLRETGECFIDIPEILCDLDYPGQYLRRIKSVSLTIPCVTGPYTNVSCKLTLLSNRIRKKTTTASGGYAYIGIEDTRFTHNVLGIQSIATSGAQNDSGMFELNFRDERYLPFEGAGVISSWRLELPEGFRQFDYDTISDVIIHINYTARECGENFKSTVNDYIKEGLN